MSYRTRVVKPPTTAASLSSIPRAPGAPDSQGDQRTFRARYAAQILRSKVEQNYYAHQQHFAPRRPSPGEVDTTQTTPLPPYSIPRPSGGSDNLAGIPRGLPETSSDILQTHRIGIVGAGCAGLYLAMLLTMMGFRNVDIYEANERVGGRVYTYTFPDHDVNGNPVPKAKHNYYDIGAMRFPCIQPMKPTFDLFEFLHIPLKDYWMERPKLEFHECETSTDLGPPKYINLRYNTDTSLDDMEESFKHILDTIYKNFDEGFELLMKYDFQSSREYFREYLQSKNLDPGHIFKTIQDWETFDSSTGLFDQAFSETVLDYVDFNEPPDKKTFPSGWARVEGGTSVLIEHMQKWLSENNPTVKINTLHRVTSIERKGEDGNHDMMHIEGTIQSACGAESIATTTPFGAKYDVVFNTTTMGALQKIDLKGLPNINSPNPIQAEIALTQWQAIRSLHYDVSVKVAIKFKEAWWITKCGIDPKSGSSSTDLPIRTVVWPSWNNPAGPSIDDQDDPRLPTVIITSYTWAQDAARMASLSKINSPKDEEELIELVLNNLVKLFAENENWQPTYEDLRKLYLDHHSYDWNKDPHSANAFALFGPGQYSNMYGAFRYGIIGSDNRLFLCGEAISAHHAWISGALDSAATALHTYFCAHPELERFSTELVKLNLGNGTQDTYDLPDELIGEEDVLKAAAEFGKDAPAFDYADA